MNVKKFKEQMLSVGSITPWEDIEEDSTYHIPPIANLQRRDVHILEKDGDKLTYYMLGDSKKEERVFFSTSLFAKFLVKQRKF